MKYFSLNDPDFKIDFKQAVLMGQAPGKGLFFPEYIPNHEKQFLENLKELSREEIAFRVIEPFVGDSIDKDTLKKIVSETIDFEIPLVFVEDSVYSLELFHGPTGAFKDVGARFLSRCLQYFSQKSGHRSTILVATSGDTGGAVADAFFGMENVDVFILFPSGKVSQLQELQLTCYGKNIHALEVDGSFDDCQMLVKQAFADETLSKKFNFISANSINIARWLSQQFYYFFALQQWPHDEPPAISVPSGNLGNIAAGLLAQKTGLKIRAFIAACNENKSLVNYLETGIFEPQETVTTVSNAMDVGNPSNFKRVLNCITRRQSPKELSGYSFTSEETLNAITSVFDKSKYLMDPHGSVGYLALKKYQESHPDTKGIFLETAHPAKFDNIIQSKPGIQISVPIRFSQYDKAQSHSRKISVEFNALKESLH